MENKLRWEEILPKEKDIGNYIAMQNNDYWAGMNWGIFASLHCLLDAEKEGKVAILNYDKTLTELAKELDVELWKAMEIAKSVWAHRQSPTG